VSEAGLGLPLYPGAVRVKDENSATVNIDLPGEEHVRLLVAKFETSDPLEKVKDFYRERLGNEVTKFVEKSPDGKTVFEIKHGDRVKVVALRRAGDGTRIELVRVFHGTEEGN
jgi:hypothetical protein